MFLSRKGNWRKFAFNAKKYKTKDGIKETLVCSSMENLVRNIMYKAGLVGCSAHSGRRTLATFAYRKGFDLKYIKELLGHKTEEMTQIYIEPDIKNLKNAYEYLWQDVKI